MDAFDPLVKIPDFNSYDKWFGSKSGAVALFPYITEFIARQESIDQGLTVTTMDKGTPVLEQKVAYAPMSTT